MVLSAEILYGPWALWGLASLASRERLRFVSPQLGL